MNLLKRLFNRQQSDLQARVEEAERELPALRRELSNAVRKGETARVKTLTARYRSIAGLNGRERL